MSERSIMTPFAPFEWTIAWRYLRARRKDGGISVMSVISLVGIALAVFALIATMAVRSGFRSEFVGTILGANAHMSISQSLLDEDTGQLVRGISNYDEMAENIAGIDGVTRAAPVVRGQVMASTGQYNSGVEVYGERLEDLQTLPLIANPESAQGDLADLEDGIAIGSGVARELGVGVGDVIDLISPNGVQTPFGTSPRINAYKIVYIFQVGRYDIDRTRIYMPLEEAQSYFNSEGRAGEIEVMVEDPEAVDALRPDFYRVGGQQLSLWSWRDASGSFLDALKMEDNVMFIIMAILVLIAALNIVSGLIMLVKNKGRDVGILRTMGLSEGSILRVFFICGAMIGLVGTVIGTILGCLFAIYIDPIFSAVNWLLGGGAWDPSVRYLSALPAKLEWMDVLSAVALSLFLSFTVTYFPARRAARMNPVEALRYE
ncbi:lipoprotein-releasing ABC transporter permease subunit [Paracoccaceae bacterium GXU_MW_L88]